MEQNPGLETHPGAGNASRGLGRRRHGHQLLPLSHLHAQQMAPASTGAKCPGP